MSLTLLIIMLIVLGSAVASSWMAVLPNRGSMLGIRLPAEAGKDPDTAEIVRGYRKRMIFWGVVFLVLMIPVLLTGRIFTLQFFLLFAWSILLMIAYYREYSRFGGKLRELRRAKGWESQGKPIVAIDTQVSKSRSRMAVSPWWMLPGLLLSLIPLVLCVTRREDWNIYLAAACPLLLQAVLLLCRRFFQKSRATAFSADPEVNRACHYLAIHSWTAYCAVMSMVTGVLTLALYFLTVQASSDFWFLLLMIAMLLTVCLGILIVFQKVRKGQNRILEQAGAEILEKEDDACHYKWGFYCNPADPRIMVPKQVGVGWTFNIGRPMGKVVGFGSLGLVAALVIGLLGMFLYMEVTPFSLEIENGRAVISAPIYGTEFELSEVESVSMSEEIPSGSRTNGAAAGDLLLGHFRLNGVGDALLYVHTDQMPCVVIELEDRTIYFTGDSPEENQEIFEQLTEALGS